LPTFYGLKILLLAGGTVLSFGKILKSFWRILEVLRQIVSTYVGDES
jgi:hypothetical protein